VLPQQALPSLGQHRAMGLGQLLVLGLEVIHS
jgi:hypothetical protein